MSTFRCIINKIWTDDGSIDIVYGRRVNGRVLEFLQRVWAFGERKHIDATKA